MTMQRKVGRPAFPRDQVRSVMFFVRLRRAEAKRVREDAARAGLAVQNYVRARLGL